jgi:hypothetical protein
MLFVLVSSAKLTKNHLIPNLFCAKNSHNNRSGRYGYKKAM